MDNKILLYIGIAGLAYYLYTKSKDFEFTDAEKAAILILFKKSNPLSLLSAIKTVLTPLRYAELIEWQTKNSGKFQNFKYMDNKTMILVGAGILAIYFISKKQKNYVNGCANSIFVSS